MHGLPNLKTSTYVSDGITNRSKLVAAVLFLSQCLSGISRSKAWAVSKNVFSKLSINIIMCRCGSVEGLSVITKTTDRNFLDFTDETSMELRNTATSIISQHLINFTCVSFKVSFSFKDGFNTQSYTASVDTIISKQLGSIYKRL